MEIYETFKTWNGRFKKLGLTQQQAAVESGLAQAQIGAYISGKHLPNIKNFERFETWLQSKGV